MRMRQTITSMNRLSALGSGDQPHASAFSELGVIPRFGDFG